MQRGEADLPKAVSRISEELSFPLGEAELCGGLPPHPLFGKALHAIHQGRLIPELTTRMMRNPTGVQDPRS